VHQLLNKITLIYQDARYDYEKKHNFIWYVNYLISSEESLCFLVGKQLDGTISSIICLFESSTCFEQPCAYPQEESCPAYRTATNT